MGTPTNGPPWSRHGASHERNVHHIEPGRQEHFNKTYGIVHPREQWASRRDITVGPVKSPARSVRLFRSWQVGAATLVRDKI